MDKPWLMGIDLGGSGARCVLVNRSSGIMFSASGSWQFSAAPGTFGTGYDIDLKRVWEVVGKACRDAIEDAQIDSASVAAIAVSAMHSYRIAPAVAGRACLSATFKKPTKKTV